MLFGQKKAACFRRRFFFGGPDQDRTDDLLNAIEALYQLSYEPGPKRVSEDQAFPVQRKDFFGEIFNVQKCPRSAP